MTAAPVVLSAVPTLFDADGEVDPGANQALYNLSEVYGAEHMNNAFLSRRNLLMTLAAAAVPASSQFVTKSTATGGRDAAAQPFEPGALTGVDIEPGVQ